MKIAELNIKDVRPAESNTRVGYNGTDMAELIKSIESVGLLNPIVVRKRHPELKDGEYEIIAGHRRFHAFTKLGRETIPASIMDATDEDAEQIRLVENLHRKDLNPIEEAKAFQILVDHYRMDMAGIAQRADKSAAYVTRALALLKLAPKTQAMIADGTLSAAHGHQIMRVDGKQRETIEKYTTTKGDWNKRYPTLLELQDEIEKKVEKDLDKALFPKDVANYGGTETPACVTCPSNTGNQNALFDGAEKGSCTNPGCYSKRTAAWYKEFQAEVIAKYPDLKFIGFASMPGYMSIQSIKGFPLVDEKKQAKEIKAKPEKFGFAILKPGIYTDKKKPSVAVVSLNKKEKPQVQREETDYQRKHFIDEAVQTALHELALSKVTVLEKKHVLQMLRAEGAAKKMADKMSVDELLVRLWVRSLGEWQTLEKLKQVGIDGTAIAKEAEKKAAAEYDAKNKKGSK